jgi:MYXO-CTERM domain-containing protein
VVNDTTAWIGTPNPWSVLPSDGSFFLDLTNYQLGFPFAGVTQSITTQVGATYTLSFDLGGSTRWGLPDSITASAGNASQTFTTPSTGTLNDWYHETLQFTATSSTTLITLQGNSGGHYVGLDNVSVELGSPAPIPEPQTWALMAAGLAALAGLGRRRR